MKMFGIIWLGTCEIFPLLFITIINILGFNDCWCWMPSLQFASILMSSVPFSTGHRCLLQLRAGVSRAAARNFCGNGTHGGLSWAHVWSPAWSTNDQLWGTPSHFRQLLKCLEQHVVFFNLHFSKSKPIFLPFMMILMALFQLLLFALLI